MKSSFHIFRGAHKRFAVFMALACFVFSLPVSAQGAISYVQSNYSTPQSSPTSVAVVYTAAQVAGDLNVVVVGWNNSTPTVSSVADSKGNVYVRAIGPTTVSGALSQSIYYAKNILAAAAGTNTVTVTFSGAAAFPDIRILEYSGADLASPVDVTSGAGGTSSGTANSGAATTTNATDLIFGANVVSNLTTATGANFTRRILTVPDSDIAEDRSVTAVGSYSATSTVSGPWVMQMVAFRTPVSVPVDTQAPTAPGTLTATTISGTQINLSWVAATDNVGVTGYRVERCQGAGCTTFAQISAPTSTTFNDTGLTAGTTYLYRVRATDAAGNLGPYNGPSSATTTAPDTQAPTAPGTLTATAISGTQINLSWVAATDNVGVTGYFVERCQGAGCTSFAQIGTPTTTTFNDTGLTAGTTYLYRVRATDAAGNLGSYNGPSSATTTAPDTQAPSAPGALTATAASSSQINLTWTAATDNVGVTAYLVERCQGTSCTNFVQVAAPTASPFADTGLAASTTYNYRVRAMDAAGNLSSYTATASATTSSSLPPSTPTFIQVSSAVPPSGSVSSAVATFNAAQLSGDLNVVIIGTGDDTSIVSSVTDVAGNTYIKAVGPTLGTGVTQSIYYAKNIASAPAGVNKVTVAFSNSAAFPDIRILEYSGIDTTLPVDATAVGTGSNATSSSGALTTTNPVDLLVSGNIVSSLTSAGGANFTTRIITNPNGDIAEDRVVNAAGSYTATATLNNSGGWVMQMVAFRAAGGSTPPTDTTPPTVSITSPSQGGSVNGSVIVMANADDANGVAGVQFKADGVNIGAEDTIAPYSVAWDTSALTPGSVHTLTAVARDNAGNSAVSTAISVTVQSSATLSTIGQWQGPVNMPLVAVHVSLMPNGKILVADGQEFGPSAQVWDPVNNTFTAVTAPANIFCAGHTVMPDGRVFVNGGHISSHVGLKSTLIFNYQSNTWFTGPAMSFGRWYPTATVLPDGRIITISGESTCDGCYVPTHEIYDPSNNTWSILTGADFSFAFYPHVFVLPTGKLLVASTTEAPIISRVLDLNTKVWTAIGSTAFDGGSAIMYRPGKILKTGTSVNPDAALRQAFPTAYVLDMNQSSPAWRQVSSMSFSRTFHSMVMLPDGNVLVVGGGNTTDAVNPAGAIYQGEIWSPTTETFTPVASMTVPRLYHSNALLLPDGRVVMTGGGRFNDGTLPTDRLNAEYYLPPYMFKGTRPTITSAPSTVQYASNFTIQTPDAAQIGSVVMIRLGSSTHSFNMSQNYVPLTFSAISGGLSVQGPSDANLASPGYYMLFIVNTNGVPSVAPIVNLPLGTVATQPPAAPANLVASGGIGTVSLSWSASSSATGYSVYRSTTSGFTPSSATLIAQPSGTTFVDTSFVSSGTYFYLVTARNGAPSESSPSNQAAIDVSVDTGAPTPPSNLTATSTSNSQITLGWTAATDDVGVTGYRVERCQGASCTNFAQIATSTTINFGDTGLAASTTYQYRVRATDAVGNLSQYSNIASATTGSAPPPPTTPTFIQQNSATPQSASSTTVTVTYTAAQHIGDLNVVVVGWNNTTAGVSTVTDTAGNLYARAVGPTIGSNEGQSIYYAKNIVASAAGVNKVTVTFSPAAAFPDVRILEYSGIDAVTPIDVTGGAVGTSATSSSGTVTTTNATDLLFAANTVATTTNGPGTGFTSRVITTPDSDIAEDKVVTVTGNYSATATISSGAWVMQIVAFRAAGSVAPAFRMLEGGHAIE